MNPTTVFPKSTFSKRLIAAATVIGLATTGALIVRNVPFAGEAISVTKPVAIAQRVDVCSNARPAGLWFPPQLEMQFAGQCGANTASKRRNCTMKSTPQAWLPPQVEMQLAEWCA